MNTLAETASYSEYKLTQPPPFNHILDHILTIFWIIFWTYFGSHLTKIWTIFWTIFLPYFGSYWPYFGHILNIFRPCFWPYFDHNLTIFWTIFLPYFGPCFGPCFVPYFDHISYVSTWHFFFRDYLRMGRGTGTKFFILLWKNLIIKVSENIYLDIFVIPSVQY